MELRWCRPFDLNKRPKDEETQLHWHENEMGGWEHNLSTSIWTVLWFKQKWQHVQDVKDGSKYS